MGTCLSNSTKITDLPDECLMNIFQYLDIRDLFMVAIASARLRRVAVEVRKKQAKGSTLFLYRYDSKFLLIDNQAHEKAATKAFARDFKGWLLYLRYFGSTISHLVIDYANYPNIKWYQYAQRYINTYCAESLNEIEIEIWNISQVSFHLSKPFINVHTVSFRSYFTCKLLPQIAECFPNLKHLKLRDVHFFDCFDRVYFPHLEQLYLKGNAEKRFTNFLDLNRQLKSLNIDFPKLLLTTLLEMIKNHSPITKLQATGFIGSQRVKSVEIQRIANEHSSMVELDLKDITLFRAQDVIALIEQLKSLKRFDCRIKNKSDVARLKTTLNQNKWTLTTFKWNSKYVQINRKN